MDFSSILRLFAQVAGIGGLALWVLYRLFREIIRKNIFPHLAQTQAYRIMRLIVWLTFLIATTGIVAWVYVQASEPKQPIRPSFPEHADVTHSLNLIQDTLQDIREVLHQGLSSFTSLFIMAWENWRREIPKTAEPSQTPDRQEAPIVAVPSSVPAVQAHTPSLPEGEGLRRHTDWPSATGKPSGKDAENETSDQGRRYSERPQAAAPLSETHPDNKNITPPEYEPQEQRLVHTPSPSPQVQTLSPPTPVTSNVDHTPEKPVRREKTRPHLNLIASFADSVCKESGLEIPRDKLKLSGKGEAKLNELIKNLADQGVEKAVSYDRLDYQDFIQKDIAAILYMSPNCISTIKKYLNKNLIRKGTKPIRYSQIQYQEKYVFDLQYCENRGAFVNCSIIIINKGKIDRYAISGTSRIVDGLHNEILVSEVTLGDKRQNINKYSFIDNDFPSYGILKANLYFYGINPEANSLEMLEIHSRVRMASVSFKNIELLDTKGSLEESAPTNGVPPPRNLTVISLTQ